MPRKRQRRREKSRGPRVSGRESGGLAAGRVAVRSPEGRDGGDVGRWRKSRSGARAGRGFHFQERVGAWIAAKLAAESFGDVSLVPEGFEDLSLAGEKSRHVQVKSRTQHRGRFPASEATGHILEAWERHVVRGDLESRLVLVFERGVEGEALTSDLETTLATSSSGESKLIRSVTTKGSQRGADVDQLLSSTVLVGMTQDEVHSETIACLDNLVHLPSSALDLVTHRLRVLVADASDSNASLGYTDRRSFDKTELVGEIERTASQIDITSLEAAIREGVCESLEYGNEELADAGRFYEGEATQPFHVAAGLVVHRPDLMQKVLSGLDERFPVVITGPSGVGKSAALWTIPKDRRDVLWFRVRRLAVEDVPSVVRLARAYRASQHSPVGFLIDSAGTGDFAGWARLRAEAAAVPGILLAATARDEDLMALGDLAQCVTVAVRLDEQAAETIYSGLADDGATGAAHWREAFEQSGGLTLEFAHLLTRGQRLRSVIDDQIRRRISEDRHSELEVLALVSVIDRWSATVSTADVTRVLGLSDFALRGVLERLNAEHLVVERDGRIGGLHRLRSIAICQAVHDSPPPALDETIRKVLPILPTSRLHRFIAAMLRDNSDARNLVIDYAAGGALGLERFANCVRGLRLADFHELANTWNDVAAQHVISPTIRPTLFMLAIAQTEPFAVFSPEVRKAQEAIAAVPGRDSRGDLVAAIGWNGVARLLVSASEAGEAAQLLAAFADIGPDFATAVDNVLDEQSPLASALREAPLEALTDCLSAARDVDEGLAQALMEVIGGELAAIRRIRADNPWVTEMEVREGEGGPVGFARILHASENLQGAPDEQARRMGRMLLGCLPRLASVDVKVSLPGNHELIIANISAGVSRLSRTFDRTPSNIRWTQECMRAAGAMAGEADTVRLAEALPLLDEAAELLHQFGTVVVTGWSPDADFDERLSALGESGRALRPSLGQTQTGDTVNVEESIRYR